VIAEIAREPTHRTQTRRALGTRLIEKAESSLLSC